MYNLTERKLTIGIYGGIFLIFLFILKALYAYVGYEEVSNIYVKQAILVATQKFLWIGIVILLYNIIVVYYKQENLRSLWKWLIRLEVIIGILAVLTALRTYYGILGPLIIVTIVAIVIYIIIFSRIHKLEKEELPDISVLHEFILAFVIVFALLIALGFVIEYGRKTELEFIKHLLTAIPFIFIVRFLIKVRKRIFYNKTASV